VAADWVQEFLDAWNARDVEAVVGFLHEDVVYTDVPLGARVEGRAAVREFATRIMSAYSSDFRRELGEIVVADGTTYAFEWTETGTNDLGAPGSRFPRTGRPFSFPVVSIGRLRDGRIVEHRDYWDLADYLQQVGLLPGAAAGR
jgi:steroid delta-isomerase-like uncharacterized protein